MEPKKVAAREATAAAPATPSAQVASATTGAAPVSSRPSAPEGLPELFLPASGEGPVAYQPSVAALCKLHFADSKSGIDCWRQVVLVAPLTEQTLDLDFGARPTLPPTLLGAALHEPLAGAAFLPLPKRAPTAKQLTSWKKSFATQLYQQERLELLTCPALELTSAPDESLAAFQARVDQNAREARDAAVQKLRVTYDPKFEQLKKKLEVVESKLARERAEETAKQVDTVAAIGSTVLGALLGRSAVSATTVRRGASVVRSAGRVKKEAGDVARAEAERAALHEKWATLQAEANAKLAALQAAAPGASLAISNAPIAPRKADIDVGTLTLVWLPFRRDPSGASAYVFSAAPG